MADSPNKSAQLEIKPTAAMGIRIVAVIGSATFLALLLVYLLVGGGGDLLAQRATITTFMPDATGLSTNSQVRLNGIQIGKVDHVEISGLLDPQRAIRVRARVLKRFLKNIPVDSQTDIDTDTLVGYAFVDINLGKSPQTIGEDGILQSEPLKQAEDRADELRVLQGNLTKIDQLLADAASPRTDLGRFVLGSVEYDKILSDVGGFDKAMHAFITPQSDIGRAFYTSELYDKVARTVASVDGALQGLQNGQGMGGKLLTNDEQYNQAVRQLTDVRAALADVNAGKGSLGPMLQDDEVYRRVTRELASIDRTMTSLNAGEGRAGQLLNNPQLYESLRGSLTRIADLLRDLQENPRKYLRTKIF